MINIQWQDAETVSINNTNTSAIIEDTSDTLNYFADKYIITKFQLKTGDLVEYAGIKYIVTSQIDRNIESRKEIQYNYRARIRQADYIIKVVIDGKVEQLPSIIEPQSFGIVDGKYISLSDDKIVVTINNTYAISKGMRFIKLGEVWKVVGIDRAKNGLVILYCDVDLYNDATDDLENEIANIDLMVEIPDEPEEPENPPIEGGYTVEIIGADTITIYSDSSYTAKVFNGVEVTDKQVVFSIDNTTLATINSQSNNQCVVRANTDFKTGEITLKAKLIDDENVFTEKKILITGF